MSGSPGKRKKEKEKAALMSYVTASLFRSLFPRSSSVRNRGHGREERGRGLRGGESRAHMKLSSGRARDREGEGDRAGQRS